MGPTAKIPIVFQWPVWPLINPQTKGFSDRRCQRMSVSQTIWRGAVDWAEPRRSGLARVIPAVLGSGWSAEVGRPEWALAGLDNGGRKLGDGSLVLSRDGGRLAEFRFEDFPRADTSTVVAQLKQAGMLVRVVSGDRDAAVRPIAQRLDVPYFAAVLPAGKIEHIAALEASGRKVLMVGDGLNDTPALAAAHASMAPASAADVGRSAADFVFLRESLSAVPQAISVARDAGRLVRQNLALAVAYNVVAVPVAIMGYATPLVAAVAMSGSSILVVANALRLKQGGRIGLHGAANVQLSSATVLEASE